MRNFESNFFSINHVFAFKVVFGITRNDDEIEPQIVKEYQHKHD
jgi:hypothetical protein